MPLDMPKSYLAKQIEMPLPMAIAEECFQQYLRQSWRQKQTASLKNEKMHMNAKNEIAMDIGRESNLKREYRQETTVSLQQL